MGSVPASVMPCSAQRRKARRRTLELVLFSLIASTAAFYLINYVDSPSLRQSVQKALNRGENYHQLRRAISSAGSGKLRFKTEHKEYDHND